MFGIHIYSVDGDVRVNEPSNIETACAVAKSHITEKTWGIEIFGNGEDGEYHEHREYRLPKGFYKVHQSPGGTLICATFFNPDTKESFHCVVRDYDYSDCSRDREELYQVPTNESARRVYLHHNGAILEGDTIKVVKGRKVPIGTIAKVRAIYDFHDKYGRFQCRYVYFEGGGKTNIDNCELVEAV